MKKSFDVSYRPQIESGEYKVVTADEHPVRICCWDAEEDWPIVALVKDHNPKSDYCYPMMCDNAGVSATRGMAKQLFVITPEPELTPFQERLAEYMGYTLADIENNQDDALNHINNASNELMELAVKGHWEEVQQAYRTADEVQYQKGYRNGVAHALYNIEQVVEGSNFAAFPRDTHKKLNDMIEKLKNEK